MKNAFLTTTANTAILKITVNAGYTQVVNVAAKNGSLSFTVEGSGEGKVIYQEIVGGGEYVVSCGYRVGSNVHDSTLRSFGNHKVGANDGGGDLDFNDSVIELIAR